MDLKLCFIDDERNCAFFTEKDVTEQWGDDWNDAPYEHNAEYPYEYDYDAPEQGVENGRGIYPKITIKRVYFELDFYNVPRSGYLNSPYSVENINRGVVAWIWNDNFKLFAGTTMEEFIDTIQDNGGKIYVELEKGEIHGN